MYKRNSISKEMKAYLLPKDTRPGRVQGNPKIHKNNHPLRGIINGQHTTTENIGLVRLSKAILHAFLVSFRSTLGYKALISRQNMIASGGNGWLVRIWENGKLNCLSVQNTNHCITGDLWTTFGDCGRTDSKT
jgi:hypothetical protein